MALFRKLIISLLLSVLIASWASGAHANENISFDNELVDAANIGDEQQVVSLLKSGYPSDSRGAFGVTPLMRAAYNGHIQIAQILISNGADAETVDMGGATALHIAARQGQSEIVKLLLAADSDVNAPDSDGWTPLMRAISTKKLDVISMLLDKGADPYKTNRWHNNAIINAVQTNDLAVVKLLAKDNRLAKLTELDRAKLLAIAKSKGNDDIQRLFMAESTPKSLELKPASVETKVPMANESTLTVQKAAPVVQEPTKSKAKPLLGEFFTARSAAKNSATIAGAAKEDLVELPSGDGLIITNAAPPVQKEEPEFTPPKINTLSLKKTDTATPVVPTIQKVVIEAKQQEPVLAVAEPAKDNLVTVKEVATLEQKSTLQVREAVKVPIQTRPVALPPATEAVQPKRFSPSDNVRNSFWLEAPFASENELEQVYQQIKTHTALHNMRLRVTKPMKATNGKAASLRAGPISNQGASPELCNLISGGKGGCYVVKEISQSSLVKVPRYSPSKAIKNLRKPADHSYRLQLGAFYNENMAIAHMAELTKKHPKFFSQLGYTISVPKRGSHDRQVFYLRVGEFTSRDEAKLRAKDFEKLHISYVVIKD